MNRNNKFLIALSFAVFVQSMISCRRKLDLEPQTTISDESFWQAPGDLAIACNYLYSFLPGLGNTDPTTTPAPYQDMYSDVAFGTSTYATQISDGSRITPATSTEWIGFYQLIRAANNILEKSVKVTGDTAAINKYLGEARFFRAWGYFELVKRYGDVPYINKVLGLNDTLLYSGRVEREKVIDSIYADLDFAAANCPEPDIQPSAEYGRITATAALALKSRVALFAGTWDKFHSSGNHSKHLQNAIDASNAVISGGRQTIFTGVGDSSYFYEFQYQNEASRVNHTYGNNKENILVRLYGQSFANNISSHTYERTSLEQGNIYGTKAMMDAYLFKDGLPAGKSPFDSSNQQTGPMTEFRNRDPRVGMTFMSQGILQAGLSGILPYSPGILYKLRKYNINGDWLNQTSFVNFNIIRYAEVLLNYAEAVFEQTGAISDADLNRSVNLLRARVSMPLLTNAFVTANGLDMRMEIRRERMVELAFEGLRYWDLLRWKTAETVLPQAVLGPKYFPVFNSPGTPLTTDGFVIYESAGKRRFNAARDYLWPLPSKELSLTPNLTQNPNW